MNKKADLELPTKVDSPADENAGMLGLLEVARIVQERVEAALESVGLPGPKNMTTAQGGDRVGGEGLVERVEDPIDRRAVRARVTELGEERYAAGTQAIRDVR